MKKQYGQAILEYIILVSLIALVGMVAFQALGLAVHTAAVESVTGITNQ